MEIWSSVIKNLLLFHIKCTTVVVQLWFYINYDVMLITESRLMLLHSKMSTATDFAQPTCMHSRVTFSNPFGEKQKFLNL